MDNRTGKTGEDYVALLLQERGFHIVCRNYHSRFGEIDLIAADGSFLVFVEVKTRAEHSIGHPLEFITPAKQKRILKTAVGYLSQFPTQLQPRFDAAAVRTDKHGTVTSAEYVENAFSADGFFAR